METAASAQRLPHRRLGLGEPQWLALRPQRRLRLPHALEGARLEHVGPVRWLSDMAVS